MEWPLTRRQVNRAGIASIVTAVSGCESSEPTTTRSETTPTTVDSQKGDSTGGSQGITVVEVGAAPNPVGQAQPLQVLIAVKNGSEEDVSETFTLELDGEPIAITRGTIPAKREMRLSVAARPGHTGTHTVSVRDQSTEIGVEPYPEHFVDTDGTDFVVNGEPFYFNGINASVGNRENRAYIDEVLADAAAMGLTVVRAFAFCNGLAQPCFQPEPGVYDETAFKNLDYVIYRAKQLGIRLVLALVNNFSAHGGMTQYVEWASEESYESDLAKHDAFYTNERVKDLFKEYIRQVLTRKNTYTGVAYRNDPTIMMWELANEPDLGDNDGPLHIIQDWIEEMGAFIKGIDSNHLLSTGAQGFYDQSRAETDNRGRLYIRPAGTDFIRNHQPETIDACSMHFYPQNMGVPVNAGVTFIEDHARDAHEIVGKPVYLGEFGYRIPRKGTTQETIEEGKRKRASVMDRYFEAALKNDVNGTLVWNLDGHHYGEGKLDFETDPEDTFTEIYYPEDTRAVSVIQEYSARMLVKTAERRHADY